MATPGSAPTGGAGQPATRPAVRPSGPPSPAPYGGGPGFGGPSPFGGPSGPARPRLTRAQQTRLGLISAILVIAGVAAGLLATAVLPHVYAAQTTLHFNLDAQDGTDDNADRTLTTQTVLITGRDVLQAVSDSTSVPVDYLTSHTTATVVPNSEIIQVQVTHPDRTSGVQLANAVAQRYLQLANANPRQARLQAQLDRLQRQISAPGTTADAAVDLRNQLQDLQTQIATNAATTNVATTVAPAYSVEAPVFPNTLITLGVGALVGAALAGAVGFRLVRAWTRR